MFFECNLTATLYVYARILAPTTYIFFASALPVIAFGEQLSRETGSFTFQTFDESILKVIGCICDH